MGFKFIAEFCQNHNGDRKILEGMIESAALAGCTHGKIQTIFAEDLSRRERFEEGKFEDGVVLTLKRPYEDEYRRLKNLELSYADQEWFIKKCYQYKIEPLTTCFTRSHVKRLAGQGWKGIKVASYDCSSLAMIKELASEFQHLIISTGATFNFEIEETVDYLRKNKASYTLLHCVTRYPTPLAFMNLKRMETLRQYCDDVGFSNHSDAVMDGIKADLVAIYLGASTIERHFTILDREKTRDGRVSVTADQVERITKFASLDKFEQKKMLDVVVPDYIEMLGDGGDNLSAEELLNRDYYRGRFCSKFKGREIFNWEDFPIE